MKARLAGGVLAALTAVLCWVQTAWAAPELPAKEGIVTDDAHLFTSAQVSQLEQRLAADSRYHFYVLTVPHNENFTALADQVFSAWGMGGNDVLIAIDAADRRVEIVAERGSPVDNIIRSREPGATVADKYRALTDHYFVPDARSGNYVAAVEKTAAALSALKPRSQVILPYLIVAAAVVAGILGALITLSRRRRRLQMRKRVDAAERELTDVLSLCIERERRLQDELPFADGERREQLVTERGRIAQALPQLNELRRQLARPGLGVLQVDQIEAEARRLRRYVLGETASADATADRRATLDPDKPLPPPRFARDGWGDDEPYERPDRDTHRTIRSTEPTTVIVDRSGPSFLETMIGLEMAEAIFDDDRRQNGFAGGDSDSWNGG
ncbi:MAG: TPM domain-containing protein, partial [Alicyclobacillus shizuokensis]|nr:TPM domain-containing protein [Alicyclobacillus shizuokensis]